MSSNSVLDITETSPRDWHYVSEGGATVVLSYVGSQDSHLQFRGKVLRLRKRPLVHSQPSEDHNDDPMLAVQNLVIARLVPAEFLPKLESVAVNRHWLQQIAATCEADRPFARREMDCIDVTKRRAVLSTDLVGGERLVVEIKPKWAFLPAPTHLSSTSRSVKTRTCRFCMHSYLKSHKQGAHRTEYCPLDLFSGDETRVTRAVHALWDSWTSTQGSANNLKIFSWGKLLMPGDPDLYSALISQCSQTAEITGLSDLDYKKSFTQNIIPLLMNTNALRIISDHQRSLDPLDIEGLSQLYCKAQAESSEPSTFAHSPFSNVAQPSISDWEAFVDEYQSSAHSHDHAAPLTSNLLYYLRAYLLSTTFKDCSVMVRLGHDLRVFPAITIIDLDPKSVAKFPEWETLDKEIVEAYAGIQGKVCIDAWKH